EALVRLGPAAVPGVMEILQEPGGGVLEARARRYDALQILGAIGDLRAFEPILEVLQTEDHAFTRACACGPLASVGGPRAGAPLIAALADAGSEVRRDAAQALAALGAVALEGLAEALSHPSPQVAQGAAYALALTEAPLPRALAAHLAPRLGQEGGGWAR